MHPDAREAMRMAFVDDVANPHAMDHAAGWRAADVIEKSRQAVATAVGADSDEIVFTSGATEADNLALLGLGHASGPRRRVVVSMIEHKAVLGPARELGRLGFEVVAAPVDGNGVLDLQRLSELVDDRTLLVAAMIVNNELGTVQPVAEVGALCRAAGALLHVDAAQALGWLPLDVYELGADTLAVSGHKMGGPKGVGALFVRRDVRGLFRPVMHGGEQEEGLRPGTLPTPLIVGFAEACRRIPSRAEVAAWEERTRRFEADLVAMLPGARVNGAGASRHPGAISVTLPYVDAEALVARLQPVIAVARGSACTSGMPEPSHVLRAIGLSASECADTIRVSTGRFTTAEELECALNAFAAALQPV